MFPLHPFETSWWSFKSVKLTGSLLTLFMNQLHLFEWNLTQLEVIQQQLQSAVSGGCLNRWLMFSLWLGITDCVSVGQAENETPCWGPQPLLLQTCFLEEQRSRRDCSTMCRPSAGLTNDGGLRLLQGSIICNVICQSNVFQLAMEANGYRPCFLKTIIITKISVMIFQASFKFQQDLTYCCEINRKLGFLEERKNIQKLNYRSKRRMIDVLTNLNTGYPRWRLIGGLDTKSRNRLTQSVSSL